MLHTLTTYPAYLQLIAKFLAVVMSHDFKHLKIAFYNSSFLSFISPLYANKIALKIVPEGMVALSTIPGNTRQ